MRNSPLVVGLVFAASLGVALGSCSSSSSNSDGAPNSDGSSSTGNGITCHSGGNGTCTQAEIDTYDNCLLGQCGSQLSTCYGSGYQSGNFSGPCASNGSCISKCSCGDSACNTACGQPSSTCVSCLSSVASCFLASTCTQPACLSAGGTGGTSGGTGGHVGGLGGSSGGGIGGFTGSLGGFTGTGSGTCADLAACCNATMASLKTTCQAEYNSAVGSGDAMCGTVLSLIKQTFCP